jgi:hypothetical protein
MEHSIPEKLNFTLRWGFVRSQIYTTEYITGIVLVLLPDVTVISSGEMTKTIVIIEG